MLVIKNPEHHEKVLAFAEKIGKKDLLQKKLDYLNDFDGEGGTKCFLGQDDARAPYSYSFEVQRKKDGEWAYWFNGGLLFHGAHDGFGSGSAPTYAVCGEHTDGWAIHT